MKQAIAGVTPAESHEVTSMVVWPSLSATPVGRFLGRLYNIQAGVYIFRVGNLIALLSIPLALLLYAYRLTPSLFGGSLHGVTYKLTNRRVLEQRNEIQRAPCRLLGGLKVRPKFVFNVDTRSVQLDRFDDVRVHVRPGQEWFFAGDLVFLQGDVETFRLSGVPRPEAFRACCLKARAAYVGVQQAQARRVPA